MMKDKKITIEVQSILKDLLKNLWVIILASAIGFMGMYILNHSVYEPEYTATATMVVRSKGMSATTYANYTVSADIANVFTNVFADPVIKKKAEEHLGKSVNGRVHASVSSGTNFIDLSVTSNSPQDSYELLGAVLEVYPKVSDYVFDNATVMLLKAPSVPHTPSNKISSDNVSMIQSSFAIVSAFIIILLSVMRQTVKNEDDFKNKIGEKLLGVIKHENKKVTLFDILGGKRKKRSLRTYNNAFVSFELVEAMHKIAAKLEYFNNRFGDKVFMVTSVAENEGKSTVASNIALALSERGKKVLLVDFDFKKPALYKIFDLENTDGYDLTGFLKSDEKELSLTRYKDTRVSLMINKKSTKRAASWIESGKLKEFLKLAQEKVDFVIVDTAPFVADSSITSIAKLADKIALVVKTDYATVEVINKTVDTLKSAGAKIGGFILNDTYREFISTSFSGADEKGAKKHYSKKKYGYSYGKNGGYYGYSQYYHRGGRHSKKQI